LTINILDANDNAPVFPSSAYQTSFPAGTYTFDNFNNRPRDLITVAASDADTSPSFRQIQYSIASVSDNGGNLFTINPSSGLIQADGTFTPTLYTITVRATDGQWYV
jgi:hypothetical protein